MAQIEQLQAWAFTRTPSHKACALTRTPAKRSSELELRTRTPHESSVLSRDGVRLHTPCQVPRAQCDVLLVLRHGCRLHAREGLGLVSCLAGPDLYAPPLSPSAMCAAELIDLALLLKVKRLAAEVAVRRAGLEPLR